VVRQPVNQGKGAAVRTGVSLALGEYTAYMDADMAIGPQAIPLLLDGLATHDLAIGSRALPDSMVESTYAVRTVIGRLFIRLVTTGTGLGLQDTQCGFKAFHTPTARLHFHLVRIDRFAFDVEILARARCLGLRIAEVPVQWKHVPGSTIHPLHDPITMLIDVCRSRLGLLPIPPVPAVGVRDASARTPSPELEARVRDVVAETLAGVPVPLVTQGPSVIALLPLVGPEEVALVYSALRTELEPLQVSRRAMGIEALRSLGPLADRLRAPPAPGGSA
jgi:hypothetical protein